MPSWQRITWIAGVTAGAVAAGAGAVLAAERMAASRLRLLPDPEADEPFGELRGHELTVTAPDGVPLHVEVHGPDDAELTVVFCHGYSLHQDCWHYQRRDLASEGRLVFWDQRGHGRSRRGPGQPVTVDQTGDDLAEVLRTVAPGRVILVGQSMGGMTIMALAGRHPELFGSQVAGVVLISTAAGGLSHPDGMLPGLPSPLRAFVQRAAPAVLRGVAADWCATLVERGRLMSREAELLATRFLAFGDPQVSLALTEFTERMIRQAPVGVIADFYSALLGCDQSGVLDVLGNVPVTVVTGDRDRMIPPRLGAELADAIPGAQLAMVDGAGHALMLERPDVVNDAIVSMLAVVRPAARLGKHRRARRGNGGHAGTAGEGERGVA